MKYKAFTLAEFLITLAIIGVIAALVLPALMHKINFLIYKYQAKQEYSQFISTLRLISNENGQEYNCYYGNGLFKTSTVNCANFWNDFFSKRSVINICKAGDLTCRPIYKTNYEVENSGGHKSHCTLSVNDVRGYVLSNGVIYYPWLSNSGSNGNFPQIFTLDINGKSGPNKFGYDVFYLHLYKNSKGEIVISNDVCESPIEKDGTTFADIIK